MRVLMAAVVAACVLASPAAADEGLGRIVFPQLGQRGGATAFRPRRPAASQLRVRRRGRGVSTGPPGRPRLRHGVWGEALTHNHPLWRYQDREAARKVLAALGPTPDARRARAATAREQAYLATLDVLYGDGDKAARDRDYAAALERLSAAYPDDDEAKAFHALAILGTNVERRDFAVDMRAAALVEDVFLRNQEHPGALHYMIHTYRQPDARAARPSRGHPIQPHRRARRSRAAHDLAHLLRPRHVGRRGHGQRGVVGGQFRARGAQGPRAGRAWLSRLPLAVLRLPAAGPHRRCPSRRRNHMGTLLEQARTRGVAYHFAAARASWVIDSERWNDSAAGH